MGSRNDGDLPNLKLAILLLPGSMEDSTTFHINTDRAWPGEDTQTRIPMVLLKLGDGVGETRNHNLQQQHPLGQQHQQVLVNISSREPHCSPYLEPKDTQGVPNENSEPISEENSEINSEPDPKATAAPNPKENSGENSAATNPPNPGENSPAPSPEGTAAPRRLWQQMKEPAKFLGGAVAGAVAGVALDRGVRAVEKIIAQKKNKQKKQKKQKQG